MTGTLNRRAFFDSLVERRVRDLRRHREYYRDRVRWLKAMIPSDASVIDIGCGIGAVLSALPNPKKIGIDFSPKLIAKAKDLYRGKHPALFVVDDVEALQMKGEYEYVLLLDTINYVGDAQTSLENIRKNLCTERTRLFVTSFNFLWAPLFRIGELVGYKTRFPAQNWLSRSSMMNLLAMSGFEVIETGGRVLCPIWIPLVSWFCNAFLASLPLFRRLCLVQTFVARPSFAPLGSTEGGPAPKSSKEFSVTVLSAMRNEKGNVRPIVDAMPTMGSSTEILFIEGHSTDGTWEEIQSVQKAWKGEVKIRGLKQPGKGKADALHYGIRESTGDLLIVYDGDFTVHPSELPKLYAALSSGRAEFVNASRLVYPFRGKAMPIPNLLGNKLFSLLFSWLFRQPIVDVLSPVKAFFRKDYERMTTRFDPFGDFDLFFGACRQQRRIREVPIHYLERSYGQSKMRPFRHGWLLFKLLLKGAKVIRWV